MTMNYYMLKGEEIIEATFSNQVNQYYSLVDRGCFEFEDIFVKNIRYDRCGVVLSGYQQLMNFYEAERGLKGDHYIKEIIQEKNVVVTQGVFVGTNGKGEDTILKFMDLFEFNNKGLVKNRETFLRCKNEIDNFIDITKAYACESTIERIKLHKLLEFYKTIRRRKGINTIKRIIRQSNIVVVKGIFEETNCANPCQKKFLDIFKFNENDIIYDWKTYLASCYEMTL